MEGLASNRPALGPEGGESQLSFPENVSLGLASAHTSADWVVDLNRDFLFSFCVWGFVFCGVGH